MQQASRLRRADALDGTRPARLKAPAMVKPYFATLSGIRGVAALFVVVEHAPGFFTPMNDPMGGMAVDMFFMLSGAVIDASYGAKLRQGMGLGQFAGIRAARLYPLYALGSAVMLLALLLAPGHAGTINARFGIGIPGQLRFWLPAALMLPLTSGPNMYPFDPPAWSLFFEILANLVYVAFAARITARSAGFIAAVCFALLVPDVLLHGQDLFISGTLRVGFGFFLGVALYRQLPAATAPVASGRWLAWLILLVLAGLLGAAVPARAMPGVDLLSIGLAFPTLLYLALRVQPAAHVLPVFLLLGDISYAIYTLHEPLLVLLFALKRRLGVQLNVPAPWSGMLFLSLLGVFSILADRATRMRRRGHAP